MNENITGWRRVRARTVVALAVLFSCVFFGGCDSDDSNPLVPSLQPLYTAVDLDFDPQLFGNWVDKDSDVRFIFQKEDEQVYKLTVFETEGGSETSGEFVARLVRLGEEHFLDLYPRRLSSEGEFYQLHLLPAHTFARVVLVGDSLTLSFLDSAWLKHQFEDKKVDTPHASADGFLVLTGTTEEIQDLAYRYAKDDEAFGIPLGLVRTENKEPQ